MSAPTKDSLLASQKFIRIGDTAPNFSAQTSIGPINLYEYLGSSWGVLFSHPRDFTPVCTTELGRVAALTPEWEKRNVKPLALSVDTTENHGAWIKDIADITGSNVKFPIIADDKFEVSLLYGMLDPTHLSSSGMPFTVRSVYIIDSNKKVRLILTYPASTGRNFTELLRVIDSLQLADSHKVATPADWEKGQDTVVLPTVSTEDAKKLFPAGIKEVRPWLRTTPDPSST